MRDDPLRLIGRTVRHHRGALPVSHRTPFLLESLGLCLPHLPHLPLVASAPPRTHPCRQEHETTSGMPRSARRIGSGSMQINNADHLPPQSS